MKQIYKILAYTRHFWPWFFSISLLVISVSLLSLAVPFLSKEVVDIVVSGISSQSDSLSKLGWLFLLIFSADLSTTTLTVINQYLGDRLSSKMKTFLYKSFYQHVLHLDISYFDNEVTGTILNKMQRGVQSTTDFIQNMTNNFLPFFLTALITIIALSHYSLVLSVLLFILFPVYIAISHRSSLSWRVYEQQKNKINDFAQGRVNESIAGIRVVKAFAKELTELKNLLTSRHKVESLTQVQSYGWHAYDFARRLFLNIILFGAYIYIIYSTFQLRYTIGEMTLLLQLVNQARFPLFAMSFILGQIQDASAGAQGFFEVVETLGKIKDRNHAKKLIYQNNLPSVPDISFQNVNFSYDASRQILNNIDFSVAKGEKLALIGESGQGKSTIVNLLLRFYEPNQGKIYIQGQNINKFTQYSLRENIGVVLQDTLLFSGTIEENISYAKPGTSHLNVIAAAKAANAHDFIKKLPKGYKSIIGERGVKLSGGQKQRIAIARAILKNAPIIILDEATSSLDTKAEQEVQKGLDRLLHQRTAIIIAHRLSTIRNANKILVLAGGQVAEFGNPQDLLMNPRSLYSQLISLQQTLPSKDNLEEKTEKLKLFDLVS